MGKRKGNGANKMLTERNRVSGEFSHFSKLKTKTQTPSVPAVMYSELFCLFRANKHKLCDQTCVNTANSKFASLSA